VKAWLEACVRAFPDYRFEEPEPPYISSDRAKVIAPWRMLATHTGAMDPPGFAPTGRPVVIEGVDHWWFRDGLVARYRADYDSMDVSRQLGLLPARGSRAERVMAALQRGGARLRR
jgi:predicted ester cyclase